MVIIAVIITEKMKILFRFFYFMMRQVSLPMKKTELLLMQMIIMQLLRHFNLIIQH